ncbi:TRAP transporter large permease [Rubrimonas cliftonensis]|uniref:TRAP transporter large permease protein n=1 Tax=Rubrimonas cliftonensis TaxID=89524 RepID=A0A1H3WW46_9RHOB|nr:TRAP transporter large permease subunit [Rubrimonas cliftonensis]SDZ91397.1 TRAP transporter, DctM subunit [Rubrimonas cliftonensis]
MGVVLGSMVGVLALLLAGGVWIGLALGLTGMTLLGMFRSMPLDKLLPQYVWNILTTSELVALPLFIVMGEILFRTRLSQSLFNGLAPLMGLLPGRLLHVNVVGCSIFAAISGSSAATTQVVGRISLTELTRRGYDPAVAMGSLAGAGTLGFLIPPSNIMIIYGVLADVSILKLFAAGLIPGLLLAGCFMGWIMVQATLRPGIVPASERALGRMRLRDRLMATRELAPVVLLILCVLGSMYGGIATPSEAAAVGVLGALAIAAFQGALDRAALRDIALGAAGTCSMIALIVLGASILSNASAFLGVPGAVAQLVTAMELTPFALIAALIVLYLVLGCFLDGFSMIVMSLPIVLPLIGAAGFDKVWFGVFLVIVVEMSQITPPVGFNLFVIQGLTGESLGRIARVTLPYLLIMAAFAMVMALAPGLALWLPGLLA